MAGSLFPIIKTYGKRGPGRGSIYHRNVDANSVFQGRAKKSVFQDSPVARINDTGAGFGLRMAQRACELNVNQKAYKLGKKVHAEHTVVTTSGTEGSTGDSSTMITEGLGDSEVEKCSATIVDVCDSTENDVTVTDVWGTEDGSWESDNECPENSEMSTTDANDQSNSSDSEQSTCEDSSLEDSEPSIEILRKQMHPVISRRVQSALQLLDIPQNSKSRRDSPKENLRTRTPFCSSFLPGVESNGIEIDRLDVSPIAQPAGSVINSQIKKSGSERVESIQNKLEKTPLPLPVSNSARTPCKLSKFGPSNGKKTKAACSTLLFTSRYKNLENYFPCVSEVQGDDELQSEMGFGELSESFSVEIDLAKDSDKQKPSIVMSSSPCVPKQHKKLVLDKNSEKIDLFNNDLSSIKQVSLIDADPAEHLDMENANAPGEKTLVSETKSSKKLDPVVNDSLPSMQKIVPAAVRDSPIPAPVHPDLMDLTPPSYSIPLDCLHVLVTAIDMYDQTQSDNLSKKKSKQKKCKKSGTKPIPVDGICMSAKDSAVTTFAGKPDNLPTKKSNHKKSASLKNSDNFALTNIVSKNEKKIKDKAARKRKVPPLCSIIRLNKCCANKCQVMSCRTPLPANTTSFPRDVLLQNLKVIIN